MSDGMCADAAIHDTDGHNPHTHIFLTVRSLDEQGHWQYKIDRAFWLVQCRCKIFRVLTMVEYHLRKN